MPDKIDLYSEADKAAAKHGIDKIFFKNLITAESNFNPNAVNATSQATGLTQVIPTTAQSMGYDPAELARNPIMQLDAGAKYLRSMLDKFNGNPYLAAAAYNAGPGAVEKYKGVPPYKETQNYIKKIFGDHSQIVSVDGFQMTAPTAGMWNQLQGALSKAFPRRTIQITSTMGGKHQDPAHSQGNAIDFVISGLTPKESQRVEAICKQYGFNPYNEYIKGSKYKTGDHMHITAMKSMWNQGTNPMAERSVSNQEGLVESLYRLGSSNPQKLQFINKFVSNYFIKTGNKVTPDELRQIIQQVGGM